MIIDVRREIVKKTLDVLDDLTQKMNTHVFFKKIGVHRYRLWWQNNTEPRLGNLWEKAYWFVLGTCQLPFCTPARLRLRWPRFEGDEGRRSPTFESR